MPATWIAVLALTGFPPQQPAVAPVPNTVNAATTVNDLRDAYIAVLRKSARRAEPDPQAVVPELAALYAELADAERMSHAEISRMRGCLRIRLEHIRDQLLRDLRSQQRPANRERRRAGRNGQTRSAATQLNGGGAEAARVAQLIDLIQSTIAPDSWETSGGRGSIRYFGPAKALVIRQTGEVHRHIGDMLQQLRRAN